MRDDRNLASQELHRLDFEHLSKYRKAWSDACHTRGVGFSSCRIDERNKRQGGGLLTRPPIPGPQMTTGVCFL